ncbi:transcription antitermination factor NusB [Marivirga harenae]|uniref:transcription antitermination factor NusB n=1 Tax=Marivirga harenae TaxID=2010992 RepID=UPI0026DEC0BC|nr:transcription antitermination factor NusB [Marivirga harenae]WKV12863.1 transcription antitermination factor NusB [Marivirga harenae]|tara:strand:- start:11474 stop:12622 length:1149 start_codon:yes stop_codon:yes gene_type:complete
MQALYAVQKCEDANFELALDHIDDIFTPDLNSMEVQDKALLKQNAKIAKKVFKSNFQSRQIKEEQDSNPEIRSAVSDALDLFQTNVKKDISFIKKDMLEAVNTLLENYYLSIKLLEEFSELALEDVEKRKTRLNDSGKQVFESELNLFKNKGIKIIKENDALQNEFTRFGTSWEDDMLDVQEWYRDILKKADFYKEYVLKNEPSFEEDVETLDKITRQVILKSEAITNFMAERDLYWEENKSALKSMLKKSIKSLDEMTQHIELIELSANWEEDSEFFKNLFQETIVNNEEYEKIVSDFAKNWATDRIAVVDMIILKMAVAEMLNFPSIPVKVTINEYIELSKNYSTQKSKQFVNGLLDKISISLEKEDKIKKSGRGLIDNK